MGASVTGRPLGSVPWGDREVIRLGVASAVGLVAIGVSWFGTSGSADTGHQALWLNIGVAGLVIAALSNAGWLLHGRRQVGRRRAELIALQPAPAESRAEAAAGRPVLPLEETLTMPLDGVRVPGQRVVHRPDCPLVAGKAAEPVNAGEGPPCGVCVP